MAAVKNPPSPFCLPSLRLAVRMGKLVALESWARFGRVCDARQNWTLSADHREVRTALSCPAVPLVQVLVLFLFFMESNLRSRVPEFEVGYFLPFFFFFFFFLSGTLAFFFFFPFFFFFFWGGGGGSQVWRLVLG